MRTALFTILPMLAAAILVMVGGTSMARRETETRTPIDRDRLFAFSDSLREETSRLEQLYVNHLEKLATQASYADDDALKEAIRDIAGIRLIRVFRESGKDLSFTSGPGATIPEVELEGRRTPLNPSDSLVIESSLLEEPLPEAEWLNAPGDTFVAFCSKSKSKDLIVILVDIQEVRNRAEEFLASWMKTPLTPLRESGERVAIENQDGSQLSLSGPDRHGPASAIIPIRTRLGNWQVMAWDGITKSSFHDPATLSIATLISILLATGGVLLFLQQRRALKLSSDRVSFVNRVSHELGTPLTNLSLNLDLANEALTHRPEESRHRLGLVAEEVERLGRLVANVLTFSRRERDLLEVKPAPCNPSEIISQTLDSFRPALARREIAIDARIERSGPATIDADALAQITGNLISNVEKYGSSGHWLGLECRTSDGQFVLEVRDHGPGIPSEHKLRIFAPFERVCSDTNEGSSGTGLGLAIGRELAERMGGTLEILATERGAAFRLTTPAPPSLTIVDKDVSAA